MQQREHTPEDIMSLSLQPGRTLAITRVSRLALKIRYRQSFVFSSIQHRIDIVNDKRATSFVGTIHINMMMCCPTSAVEGDTFTAIKLIV